MQAFLHLHPGLLAVEEIEPVHAPLIPIWRDGATDSGPIGRILINPSGLVTIVEAKPWKDPEARLEVGGQIREHAEQVSRWSQEDLDERARKVTGQG